MQTEATKWVGRTLANGRYQVTSKLGEGGMGCVFKARDRKLDTDVVIKLPHPHLLHGPAGVARFEREIRALVKLEHPHIVRVIDVDKQDGLPFIVMQYLAGGSLEDRRPRTPDGKPQPVPLDSLRTWLPQIAEALDYIHSKGFIHRDVKPGNILFDAFGRAYLGDFGIVKAIASEDGAVTTGLTGAGHVIGTAPYMAPEMLQGEKFDHRVDQYALGVVVYQLLSGVLPYEGTTPAAVAVQQVTKGVRPLGELCPQLDTRASESMNIALCRESGSRHPSCSEFVRSTLCDALPARGGAETPKIRMSVDADTQRIACTGCGKRLLIHEEQRGKQVLCPYCAHKISPTVVPFSVADPLPVLPIRAPLDLPPKTKVRSRTTPKPLSDRDLGEAEQKISSSGMVSIGALGVVLSWTIPLWAYFSFSHIDGMDNLATICIVWFIGSLVGSWCTAWGGMEFRKRRSWTLTVALTFVSFLNPNIILPLSFLMGIRTLKVLYSSGGRAAFGNAHEGTT